MIWVMTSAANSDLLDDDAGMMVGSQQSHASDHPFVRLHAVASELGWAHQETSH